MNIPDPTIIVGHYGSGKTEFAANLALALSRAGRSVLAADLDIVNPYFRLRELREDFAPENIRVISSYYEDEMCLDSPALAASLRSCFEPEGTGEARIVDVGGDPAGATVLGRYAALLRGQEYGMWLVVNANRPQTREAGQVAAYIDAIQRASRLKVTGLVNNTHFLRETGAEDVLRGDALVREVGKLTGLPVICTAVEERLLPALRDATACTCTSGICFAVCAKFLAIVPVERIPHFIVQASLVFPQ